jgi:hypothetical protein
LVNSKSKPSDYIIPSSTTIDYKHTDQFSNHGGDFDEEWQYDDIDDSDYSSEDSHSGSSSSFTDSPLQHARSPNRP